MCGGGTGGTSGEVAAAAAGQSALSLNSTHTHTYTHTLIPRQRIHTRPQSHHPTRRRCQPYLTPCRRSGGTGGGLQDRLKPAGTCGVCSFARLHLRQLRRCPVCCSLRLLHPARPRLRPRHTVGSLAAPLACTWRRRQHMAPGWRRWTRGGCQVPTVSAPSTPRFLVFRTRTQQLATCRTQSITRLTHNPPRLHHHTLLTPTA